MDSLSLSKEILAIVKNNIRLLNIIPDEDLSLYCTALSYAIVVEHNPQKLREYKAVK